MSAHDTTRVEPRVLASDLAYVESPRWHDGRLWFAHWGTDEIVAVDLDGTTEVVGRGPGGFGWSLGWLPDGRLLVTGERLMRREPDGQMAQHADLSALSGDWNEIVVDGRGNIVVRMDEDGRTLQSIELDRNPFACMLGGPDGRTLFILAAEWRGMEGIGEAIAARTGQVLIAPAPAPRAGWP
jgi:sugar lactone lactonase YvrE